MSPGPLIALRTGKNKMFFMCKIINYIVYAARQQFGTHTAHSVKNSQGARATNASLFQFSSLPLYFSTLGVGVGMGERKRSGRHFN